MLFLENGAKALLKRDLSTVRALEQIDRARKDVATVKGLVARLDDTDSDDMLKALKEQAGEVNQGLDELEKRFRVKPRSKGITYSADKVAGRLGNAQYYVASNPGAPAANQQAYIGLARATLDHALEALNDFMDTDLAGFRDAVKASGISLLQAPEPVSMP